MFRVIGTIAAIAAIGGLTAGCGGSHTATGSRASSQSGASSSGGPIGTSRATAFAHTVNLSATDVPEMTPVGREEEVKVKKAGVEGARCSGAASPYQRIVDIHSARFKGATAAPLESLRSDVTVWPTSAVAEHDASAELSGRGRACAQHLIERIALGAIGAAHISHLSVTWLAPPLPRAHDSFAARVSLTVSGPAGAGATQSARTTAALESSSPNAARLQIPVYIDTFGFVVGPAQIGLTVTSLKRPGSAATEHRLLSVLYSRAKAHSL